MDDMEIVIIDSVQPGNHDLLDQKEAEWIHRLRTMDIMGQGGLNIRDDLKRTNRFKGSKYIRGICLHLYSLVDKCLAEILTSLLIMSFETPDFSR